MNPPDGWPWTTIGLEAESDEREIRRAYARRLKATKKDLDPKAFQDLRYAYEMALRIADATLRAEAAAAEPDEPPSETGAGNAPVSTWAETPGSPGPGAATGSPDIFARGGRDIGAEMRANREQNRVRIEKSLTAIDAELRLRNDASAIQRFDIAMDELTGPDSAVSFDDLNGFERKLVECLVTHRQTGYEPIPFFRHVARRMQWAERGSRGSPQIDSLGRAIIELGFADAIWRKIDNAGDPNSELSHYLVSLFTANMKEQAISAKIVERSSYEQLRDQFQNFVSYIPGAMRWLPSASLNKWAHAFDGPRLFVPQMNLILIALILLVGAAVYVVKPYTLFLLIVPSGILLLSQSLVAYLVTLQDSRQGAWMRRLYQRVLHRFAILQRPIPIAGNPGLQFRHFAVAGLMAGGLGLFSALVITADPEIPWAARVLPFLTIAGLILSIASLLVLSRYALFHLNRIPERIKSLAALTLLLAGVGATCHAAILHSFGSGYRVPAALSFLLIGGLVMAALTRFSKTSILNNLHSPILGASVLAYLPSLAIQPAPQPAVDPFPAITLTLLAVCAALLLTGAYFALKTGLPWARQTLRSLHAGGKKMPPESRVTFGVMIGVILLTGYLIYSGGGFERTNAADRTPSRSAAEAVKPVAGGTLIDRLASGGGNSAAYSGLWSVESLRILSTSTATQNARANVMAAATRAALPNCPNQLTGIQKFPMGQVKINQRPPGAVDLGTPRQIVSTRDMEIWTFEACGRKRRWLVADDNGADVLYALEN